MTTSHRQQIIENLPTTNNHDVILGKGRFINDLPGNQKFRDLIHSQIENYIRSIKQIKYTFAQDLVGHLQSLEPPGRFLRLQDEADEEATSTSTNNRWIEISEEEAIVKTKQAFRDAEKRKMKTIRRELSRLYESMNMTMANGIGPPTLSDIVISKNGVLLDDFPGNKYFDFLVRKVFQQEYSYYYKKGCSASRSDANLIVDNFVRKIRGLEVNGRFLKEDMNTGEWNELSHEYSVQITYQAFALLLDSTGCTLSSSPPPPTLPTPAPAPILVSPSNDQMVSPYATRMEQKENDEGIPRIRPNLLTRQDDSMVNSLSPSLACMNFAADDDDNELLDHNQERIDQKKSPPPDQIIFRVEGPQQDENSSSPVDTIVLNKIMEDLLNSDVSSSLNIELSSIGDTMSIDWSKTSSSSTKSKEEIFEDVISIMEESFVTINTRMFDVSSNGSRSVVSNKLQFGSISSSLMEGSLISSFSNSTSSGGNKIKIQ